MEEMVSLLNRKGFGAFKFRPFTHLEYRTK